MTITRQSLTDCIDPHELQQGDLSKRFNEHFLWMWGSIVTNDIITVTPALRKQLLAMFQGWKQTSANIESLIGT